MVQEDPELDTRLANQALDLQAGTIEAGWDEMGFDDVEIT